MLNASLKVSELQDKSTDVLDSTVFNIDFDTDGLLFFNLKNAESLTFNVNVVKNVRARIIYWSEKAVDFNIVEKYEVERDAYLHLIYGELSNGNLKRDAVIDLLQGSEVLVEGASVTSSKKSQTFTANHKEKYTTSNLNNYGIVSAGGDFYLDVIGRICEDSIGAKAHQDSKLLTLSDDQSTKIIPQLLIAENDVEASHAATVGQIDEMQLYYLQSRGLSEMEATALLMSGYLMPIAHAIEDEELSEYVKGLIASKVEEICSIQN